MSEETEILDDKIQQKFKKADKDEFIIGDRYRLRVLTKHGNEKPEVEILDLEKVSDGPKPQVFGAGSLEGHQGSFCFYVGRHKSIHDR